MSKFKEFWDEEGRTTALSTGLSTTPQLPAASVKAATLESLAALSVPGGLLAGWSDHQRERFAEQVTEAATSDAVIAQVSAEIGEPLPSETEEQFVDRASSALRRVLYDLFDLSD